MQINMPTAMEFKEYWDLLLWNPDMDEYFDYTLYATAEEAGKAMLDIYETEQVRLYSMLDSHPVSRWLCNNDSFNAFQRKRKLFLSRQPKYKDMDINSEQAQSRLEEYIERADDEHFSSPSPTGRVEQGISTELDHHHTEIRATAYALYRALTLGSALSSTEVANEATEALRLIEAAEEKIARLSSFDNRLKDTSDALARALFYGRDRLVVLAEQAKKLAWNKGETALAKYFVGEFFRALKQNSDRSGIPAQAICDLVTVLNPDLMISEDTAVRFLRNDWFENYQKALDTALGPPF